MRWDTSDKKDKPSLKTSHIDHVAQMENTKNNRCRSLVRRNWEMVVL